MGGKRIRKSYCRNGSFARQLYDCWGLSGVGSVHGQFSHEVALLRGRTHQHNKTTHDPSAPGPRASLGHAQRFG